MTQFMARFKAKVIGADDLLMALVGWGLCAMLWMMIPLFAITMVVAIIKIVRSIP